jgi:hypothetical protein
MISKEIGWSAKSNALYEIMKQLDRVISIAYKWTQGDFHQGTNVIIDGALQFEDSENYLQFEDSTEYILFETV